MAATMIHLLLAHTLKPESCGLYYAGNFAPDAIDMREGISYVEKGKWHLRNVPDRAAALKEFYLQIDKNCFFQEGYLVHLSKNLAHALPIIKSQCPNQQKMKLSALITLCFPPNGKVNIK